MQSSFTGKALPRGPRLDVTVDVRDFSGDGPSCELGGLLPTRAPGIAIAADARIDNRAELARELQLDPGVADAELLARGYLRWGAGVAERLRGDFAVVLWDAGRRRLLALRDPFGPRTLHYAVQQGTVRFASQAHVLIGGSSRPAFNERRVLEYLLFRYRDLDSTFFRDVRDVPAGHTVEVDALGIRTHRFWHPPALDAAAPSARECRDEFRRLFLRAVERRLSPSGTVIQVSGGLDSSSIAGAADVLLSEGRTPGALFAAAALYPGLACDESAFIREVAKFVHFPLLTWDGTRADPVDLMDPALDEPGIRVTTTGGTIDDIRIAQDHGASVILSGIGGDQLGLPGGVLSDMIGSGRLATAARTLLLSPGASRASRAFQGKQVLRSLLPRPLLDLWTFKRAPLPDWLAPGARGIARDLARPERWTVEFQAHVQQQLWSRSCCAGTVRAASAIQQQGALLGVDYRFPFLDADLVRFMLSLPWDRWPLPGSYVRYHRTALADLLPSKVRNRSWKAEFTPAFANRVRRAADLIDALFRTGEWALQPIVDRDGARRAWDDAKGRSDVGGGTWRRLWSIFTLEAWMRRWRAL